MRANHPTRKRPEARSCFHAYQAASGKNSDHGAPSARYVGT